MTTATKRHRPKSNWGALRASPRHPASAVASSGEAETKIADLAAECTIRYSDAVPGSDIDASAIARLLELTVRAVYPERGPRAVHRGQWAVLRFLAQADGSSRPIAGVAAYLDVTAAPASRAVTALIRKGLVTSTTSHGDRRARHVELTTKGSVLLKRDPIIGLVELIDALKVKDRDGLVKTLTILKGRLAPQTTRPLP